MRSRSLRSRSYGVAVSVVQTAVLAAIVGLFLTGITQAADTPIKIVALGDSLTAGYNLPASAAFPVKLERALRAKGHVVEVANAGVSGDTASGISAKTGVSLDTMKKLNQHFDPQTLAPGQRIRLSE